MKEVYNDIARNRETGFWNTVVAFQLVVEVLAFKLR
jgi:hypothetical protein